ncbi:MAG: flagellar biosynthesis protein FlhB [Thermodesulfobacteriota bacterium]|nr:flagellar biosynthesis protein FlhB [Thermodesulfobacteriota bacterium]
MAEDKGSKTEKATAKRRADTRKKGQVAKSMEVNTFAVLLSGLLALYFTGASMYGGLSGIMADVLSRAAQISIEGTDFFAFFSGNLRIAWTVLAPLFIVVFFMAALANIIQIGGPLISAEPISPKLSKINPIKGFSRLFSARSLMDLFKSIAKIVIIAVTAYLTIRGEIDNIALLIDQTPVQIGQYVMRVSFEIFLKTCWVLAALAALDFAFQRWQHERDLKMSKEEVKEELKQTEGDPLVRARIRSVQKELARKRMMSQVPEADVVVTNPIHLAVALMYEPGKAEAPQVAAKGQALLAERIKEIAREHDVPIVEDKPLAQALYKSVEVGEVIPFMFYQAVAEILAYVYRLKGKAVHG